MEKMNLGLDNSSQHNKSKKKKLWIGIIGFGILFIILISIASSLLGNSSSSTSKTKLEISNVQLVTDYTEYLGYSASIKGSAKNVTKRDFSYASIEYAVYDENGNNLGTAIDNINNLLSGDTWSFEATLLSFPSTRPLTYKLIDIKAF